ncbi:hypothetical protein KIPB_014629, partial [Kipferlia bialata]|eukprot:g14629.t1
MGHPSAHTDDATGRFITFYEPNIAVAEGSELVYGQYTFIGAEAWDLKIEGKDYLFYSGYEYQADGSVVSFCNETMPTMGNVHADVIAPEEFGCVYAYRVTGQVTEAPQYHPSLHMAQHYPDLDGEYHSRTGSIFDGMDRRDVLYASGTPLLTPAAVQEADRVMDRVRADRVMDRVR